MPGTLDEAIVEISNKVGDQVVAEGVRHYMEQNSDLFDDLTEEIADRIRKDSTALDRITNAAITNIVTNLENGTESNISIGVLDNFVSEINDRVVERLRRAIDNM